MATDISVTQWTITSAIDLNLQSTTVGAPGVVSYRKHCVNNSVQVSSQISIIFFKKRIHSAADTAICSTTMVSAIFQYHGPARHVLLLDRTTSNPIDSHNLTYTAGSISTQINFIPAECCPIFHLDRHHHGASILFIPKHEKPLEYFLPRLHHGWHFTELDKWRTHYWVHHRLKGYGGNHWMPEYIHQMFFCRLACYNLILSLRLP